MNMKRESDGEVQQVSLTPRTTANLNEEAHSSRAFASVARKRSRRGFFFRRPKTRVRKVQHEDSVSFAESIFQQYSNSGSSSPLLCPHPTDSPCSGLACSQELLSSSSFSFASKPGRVVSEDEKRSRCGVRSSSLLSSPHLPELVGLRYYVVALGERSHPHLEWHRLRFVLPPCAAASSSACSAPLMSPVLRSRMGVAPLLPCSLSLKTVELPCPRETVITMKLNSSPVPLSPPCLSSSSLLQTCTASQQDKMSVGDYNERMPCQAKEEPEDKEIKLDATVVSSQEKGMLSLQRKEGSGKVGCSEGGTRTPYHCSCGCCCCGSSFTPAAVSSVPSLEDAIRVATDEEEENGQEKHKASFTASSLFLSPDGVSSRGSGDLGTLSFEVPSVVSPAHQEELRLPPSSSVEPCHLRPCVDSHHRSNAPLYFRMTEEEKDALQVLESVFQRVASEHLTKCPLCSEVLPITFQRWFHLSGRRNSKREKRLKRKYCTALGQPLPHYFTPVLPEEVEKTRPASDVASPPSSQNSKSSRRSNRKNTHSDGMEDDNSSGRTSREEANTSGFLYSLFPSPLYSCSSLEAPSCTLHPLHLIPEDGRNTKGSPVRYPSRKIVLPLDLREQDMAWFRAMEYFDQNWVNDDSTSEEEEEEKRLHKEIKNTKKKEEEKEIGEEDGEEEEEEKRLEGGIGERSGEDTESFPCLSSPSPALTSQSSSSICAGTCSTMEALSFPVQSSPNKDLDATSRSSSRESFSTEGIVLPPSPHYQLPAYATLSHSSFSAFAFGVSPRNQEEVSVLTLPGIVDASPRSSGDAHDIAALDRSNEERREQDGPVIASCGSGTRTWKSAPEKEKAEEVGTSCRACTGFREEECTSSLQDTSVCSPSLDERTGSDSAHGGCSTRSTVTTSDDSYGNSGSDTSSGEAMEKLAGSLPRSSVLSSSSLLLSTSSAAISGDSFTVAVQALLAWIRAFLRRTNRRREILLSSIPERYAPFPVTPSSTPYRKSSSTRATRKKYHASAGTSCMHPAVELCEQRYGGLAFLEVLVEAFSTKFEEKEKSV